MSKYVYGIDLGTTYSCIAYQDEDGRPTVVKNLDTNAATTPSVVQWDDEGTVVVGQEAKDSAVLNPNRTIAFVKQLMGLSPVAITIDGRDVSPVEVSSYILKELAKQAGAQLDDEVKDVVITCPAYFGEAERTATKQAGEIAGLNVLAIIEEPTAAAIDYGVTRAEGDKTIMVYDLGGGTFDITVMTISNGTIRVVTTEGDHQLGGKKWDEEMSKLIVDKFVESSGYDGDPFSDENNEEFLQDLAIKSENLKQALSNKQVAKQVINYNGQRAQVQVTRDEFNDVTQYLVDTTLDLADKAVATAKEKGLSIDQILLVGGSTKMPQIQDAVKSHFADVAAHDGGVLFFEPDEAVAKGAAIYAMMQADEQAKLRPGEKEETDSEGNKVAVDQETGEKRALPELPKLSGGPKNSNGAASIKVVSVSTKSFGIKATDSTDNQEKIFNLILKDDELPAETTQQFGTLDNNQESVELRIYQTPDKVDKYEVDEDRFLGTATLELQPNTPKDSPISVTINLKEDGTVSLHAKDEREGGKTIDAHWQVENVMSEKEIEAAKKRVSASTAITVL